MKTKSGYLFAILFLILFSACGNPVSPGSGGNPNHYSKYILDAEGSVYGTPVALHDSSTQYFTNFNMSYTGYTGWVYKYFFGFKADSVYVNGDWFNMNSDSNGYLINISIATQGKGSLTAGTYPNSLSFTIKKEPDFEKENKNIQESSVKLTKITSYSDLEGEFTFRWYYKYDTTRIGSVHGKFSYSSY
ncbi:MAG: hypothetical protein ACHQM6_03785 [Candidatus Kapaibacterium sp.]